MKLNLSIKERIIIQAILPERSDKMTLIICEDIIKKISFTEEERKKYKLAPFQNGWQWDEKYDEVTFPIELSESETLVLKEQSKRLDMEKSITRDMLSLIKKIDDII